MDSNSDKPGMLNLDAVLGETKLTVRLAGKDYPIRSVKSLTPEEFGRVMAYGTKFASLTDADLETDNGVTVMKALDDVLEIIAPALPRYKRSLNEYFKRGYKRRFAISLQEATAILQFWTENNRTKNSMGAVTPRKARVRR